MKKAIGGVLIGLSLLLLFAANMNHSRPPDISAAIGAYLPGLILLIIGLALAGAKEWTPPQADPLGGVRPPDAEQIARELVASYQSQATKGVIGGMVVIFLAAGVGRLGGTYLLCSLPVILGGWALFIWGCANYMTWKGYPRRYGLLGILLLFGLAVLVCFPNKRKQL